MPLDGFDRLYRDADVRSEPVSVAAAGGDDPTVLESLRVAVDRGWVRPILIGDEPRIRSIAEAKVISLDGFAIQHAEVAAIAAIAVAEVLRRSGPGSDEGADRHAGVDGGCAGSHDGLARRSSDLPGRTDGGPARR